MRKSQFGPEQIGLALHQHEPNRQRVCSSCQADWKHPAWLNGPGQREIRNARTSLRALRIQILFSFVG